MIPYSYNMVDMGGIDLAEANGTVVEGLYAKIVEAVNACGDVVLYNWKFAGIEISPQYTSILLGDPITINGAVQVTEQDLVTVPGINPEPPSPPILVPIEITENGEYYPEDYEADGFNEISVEVPDPQPPVLVPLVAIENGEYSPLDYEADGFGEVSVAVPIPSAGKYQEVVPGFLGLATAYQANNGSFFTERTKTQCLFIATIEYGYKYVVFLPEQYGNRYRVATWAGKSVDDFLPYLDTAGTNVEVYSGGVMITPQQDASGDQLKIRYYFNGVNGSVVIGTSNESQVIKPILLKIQEV